MNHPIPTLLAILVATTVGLGLLPPTRLPSSHRVRQGRSIPYCSPSTGSSPIVVVMSNKPSIISRDMNCILFNCVSVIV